jgi:hypothetical protein
MSLALSELLSATEMLTATEGSACSYLSIQCQGLLAVVSIPKDQQHIKQQMSDSGMQQLQFVGMPTAHPAAFH